LGEMGRGWCVRSGWTWMVRVLLCPYTLLVSQGVVYEEEEEDKDHRACAMSTKSLGLCWFASFLLFSSPHFVHLSL
jgi:hypothetical protein